MSSSRRLFGLATVALVALSVSARSEARGRRGGGGGRLGAGSSGGCGSRGGAGFRKPNGKCADRNGR